MEGDQYRAAKLTVTFRDGHTEDFEVFMVAAAQGLLPSGKTEDGRVLYMAGEDFSTRGITAIAASPEVVAGLLMATSETVDKMLDSDDSDMLIRILGALSSMSSRKITQVMESKTIIKHPEEN